MANPENVQYVVFHRPGPAWQAGVDFREQPGVMEHVQHYAKLLEDGKLAMGGPLLAADRGGMMVAKPEVGVEELEAFAATVLPQIQGRL